jgi:hypothetical protein
MTIAFCCHCGGCCCHCGGCCCCCCCCRSGDPLATRWSPAAVKPWQVTLPLTPEVPGAPALQVSLGVAVEPWAYKAGLSPGMPGATRTPGPRVVVLQVVEGGWYKDDVRWVLWEWDGRCDATGGSGAAGRGRWVVRMCISCTGGFMRPNGGWNGRCGASGGGWCGSSGSHLHFLDAAGWFEAA